MRRNLVILSCSVAALSVLCGCGSYDDKGAPTRGTVIATTQRPPPAALSAFPTSDTSDEAARHSGEWDLVLTDVRVGEHEGFDRIVLEFTGAGVPGWTVRYVDKAVLEGSNRVIGLGGDAVLNMGASGTTWPAPGYYRGPRRLQTGGGGDVREVYVAGTFEGYTQLLAGVEGGRAPFRVFTLANPPRLVVDVQDEVVTHAD